MKPAPSASTARPAAWATSKPPLLRFLDACHADFSMETGGAVADLVDMAIEGGEADAEMRRVRLAELRDVVRDRAILVG